MENKDIDRDDIIKRLNAMTAQEFLTLGTDGLSYIKSIGITAGKETFSLHSADGAHIATGQDVITLQAIAKQNDLTTVSLQ